MEAYNFIQQTMKNRNSQSSDVSSENFLPETTDVNALVDELMPVERAPRYTKI